MTIGSIIKELRRNSNMTQEQLAELLHISASAISQWETDRVLPDVTAIPILANIFGVSADVILGIDVERMNEKINGILAAAEQEAHRGEFQRAADILQEAHRQYPKSYSIMERLSNYLVCVNSRRKINDYDEVYSLCKRILAECTDNTIRYKTLGTLATAYDYAGKREEMLDIAEQMPSFYYSKEQFMLWKWRGDEGLGKRQEYLSTLIFELITAIQVLAGHVDDRGNFVYSLEERIELWKQAIGIIEMLYPNKDYQLIAGTAESVCLLIIKAYLYKGDTENAIVWLQKCCDYIICYDSYGFDDEHTSLALRGYKSGGWIMENGCNSSAELEDALLNDSVFAVIRNDSRVQEIIVRLRNVKVVNNT